MPLTMEGPRLLLRRLRKVMVDYSDYQVRLNHIVQLIATSMNVEVCSIYLRCTDDTLELYATEGLSQEAVHQTKIRFGEGLVGNVAQHARTLNLADAKAHPSFLVRPETKEGPYASFIGVPIVKAGGNVWGVLVVQGVSKRCLIHEEVESLQTVAMVLSEILRTVPEINSLSSASSVMEPRPFRGVGLRNGLAMGHVVLHEPHVEIEHLIADDVDVERKKLEAGVYKLRAVVDKLLRTEDISHAGDHLDILETYKMFANDQGWLTRMIEVVRTGLTAEAAVERVHNDMCARLKGQHDSYLHERLHDFEDLSNRLVRILMKKPSTHMSDNLPKDAILIARSMGPAELLDYERTRLRGLVLEEGSTSAHVTIVARALGIPTILKTRDILDFSQDGQEIILDTDTGQCFLNPSAAMVESYADRVKLRAKRQEKFLRSRQLPAQTKDGTKIDVCINAGLTVDMKNLTESGADGIGLFRTELQFMISAQLPNVTEQTAFYKMVMTVANGIPVIFRTLDIGGDKVLPYLRLDREENPAMGWRAMRILLDRPGLFRQQIRALLEAANGNPVQIMFPMVTVTEEFIKAKELLNKEIIRFRKLNKKVNKNIRIGVMLEVPALVWDLDRLLPLVDFICVGTNDLLQFFFASDRGHPRLSDRYNVLEAASLRMLRHIAQRCEFYKTPVTICGEVAGDSLTAMVLLALGYTSLSMPSAAIGGIKHMIRSVSLPALQEEVRIIMTEHTDTSITHDIFVLLAKKLYIDI